MKNIIKNLLKLQNLFKIAHWQTESYAQHKAFDSVYEALDDHIDKLVETYQGKYGRILFDTPFSLNLVNLKDVDINDVLEEATSYLIDTFPQECSDKQDSDCLNIRDEILSELNKLKYLLTLT